MDALRDCPHCGAKVNASFDYCPKCNKGLFASWTAESDPKFVSKKRVSRKAKAIWGVAAAALVVAVIIANTPNPFRSRMEFADARLSEVFTPKQIAAASTQMCAVFAKAVTDSTSKVYRSRLATLEKVNMSSARKALTFVNGHSWIGDYEAQTAFKASLARGETTVTASLVGQTYPKLSKPWQDYQTGHLSPELRKAALGSCPKVADDVAQLSTLLAQYDTARSQASDLASSVPWYPEGYNDYGDGNLAWKWASGSCTLGDSCWHLKVVTESGCMNGLYAEINILDGSGSVIDYSNDLLPRLGAGQTATLEFSTYNSSAKTGELVKFNCN